MLYVHKIFTTFTNSVMRIMYIINMYLKVSPVCINFKVMCLLGVVSAVWAVWQFLAGGLYAGS